ncbi:MAG TPA: acyl-CoA dehydrogenase family protein, partial [Candidatus Binataceae bacterium]|nr:acyl-CoA dehydrogenase family protein [Candidatus Binataceae bacterium]
LRGTGSKDVIAHEVAVPRGHAIDTRQLFRGESPHNRAHSTPVYRLSPEAMLANSVATAVLGSAQFALERFIQRTRERKVILTGASKAEHGPTQLRLAEAALEVQSAELLLEQNFADFDALMNSADPAGVEPRVRVKWRAAYAAELCRRAATRLFSGSGAHAVYEPSPLQAAFRNINVGAQHASIDFDTAAEQYGRLRLR